MGGVALQLTGQQVADDDAAGFTVNQYQVEHLVAVVHFHIALGDLPGEGLVSAQQQLLAGLAAGVERTAHLHAPEGAVVEQSAVVAGERHPLGDGLVNDVAAHLGKAIHIALAGAVVAAFDRIVKEAIDAIAVIGVVFSRVDAPLGSDTVRAARAIVEGETFDFVAEFSQRSGGGSARQASAHDDDLDASFIIGSHQVHGTAITRPFFR